MESTTSVELLSFWGSMFGARARFALDLKGVKYEYREQDLGSKSQELLAANPIYKQVPVLIHDGKPISQSLIIVEYIDNVWPQQPSLLPTDAHDKAIARFWADFVDRKVYESGMKLLKSKDEAEMATAAEEFKSSLKVLDGVLVPGKPFFGGDALNFVDVALASFVPWFPAFAAIGRFEMPGADELPRLAAWMEAVRQHEVIRKTIPPAEQVMGLAQFLRNMFVS